MSGRRMVPPSAGGSGGGGDDKGRGGGRRSLAPTRQEPEGGEQSQQPGGSRFRRTGRDSGDTSPTHSSPSSATPPHGGSPSSGSGGDVVGALTENVRRMTLFALAPRPGFGQAGRKLMVFANHYEVRIPRAMSLVHYYVDITCIAAPRLKLTRDDKRVIFWSCVQKYTTHYGNPMGIVYDGDHVCVSQAEFKLSSDTKHAEGGHLFTLDIKLPRLDREEAMSIRLQMVGMVTFDAAQFARDVTANVTTPLTVLDLLIRQQNSCPMMECSHAWYPFGPTLYRIPTVPADMPSLGYGQVIWQGLFSSARLGQDYVPFINFDISHSAFTRPCAVLDFIIEVLNCRVANKTARFHISQLNNTATLPSNFLPILNKDLRGLSVIARIEGGDGTVVSEREYRADGLLTDTAITSTFEMRRGEDPARQISVADYFKERYGTVLRFPNLPVMKAGSKKRPITLPIEVLSIKSCQRSKRKLLPDQTAEMIKMSSSVASINAPTRQNRVTSLVNASNYATDQWLKAANIQIDPNMKKLEARVLQSPRLECANKRFVQVAPDKGTWDQRNEKFYISSQASKVGAIVIGPGDAAMEINFITQLLGTCRGLGLTNFPPSVPQNLGAVVKPDNNANKNLETHLRRLREEECDVVIVVIPAKNSPFYAEVKRVAEINLGLMTQCVTQPTVKKTMDKGDRQVLFNIALKINAKLGGVCWKGDADNDAKKVLFEKPTCVLGIDVTHPSPTERKTPSIAAVVGNVDNSFMQYCASVRVQKHRRENFAYISEPVRDRMNEYFLRAGQGKPQRIVVYRDGVAETQFQEVLNNELVGIREACSALGGVDYKPSITFIVAQKRHHTRFFPMNKNESVGRGMNVFQGTVVDKVITHPKYFEFYLCSHAGIQGTSRPIRYHVLTDDNKFSSDELQKVTFYLSHCFARCNRPVSLPAPLYYSDLVCRRARIHLSEKVDFSSDTMSTTGSTGEGTEAGTVSDTELIVGSTVADPIKAKMYFT